MPTFSNLDAPTTSRLVDDFPAVDTITEWDKEGTPFTNLGDQDTPYSTRRTRQAFRFLSGGGVPVVTEVQARVATMRWDRAKAGAGVLPTPQVRIRSDSNGLPGMPHGAPFKGPWPYVGSNTLVTFQPNSPLPLQPGQPYWLSFEWTGDIDLVTLFDYVTDKGTWEVAANLPASLTLRKLSSTDSLDPRIQGTTRSLFRDAPEAQEWRYGSIRDWGILNAISEYEQTSGGVHEALTLTSAASTLGLRNVGDAITIAGNEYRIQRIRLMQDGHVAHATLAGNTHVLPPTNEDMDFVRYQFENGEGGLKWESTDGLHSGFGFIDQQTYEDPTSGAYHVCTVLRASAADLWGVPVGTSIAVGLVFYNIQRKFLADNGMTVTAVLTGL